ncbi:MAG: plasmid mobilization protein [Alphaproteobacteria bacterium]
METDKPKYAVPYSFRMTAEEYQRLCEAAGSRTISDYIRRQLLGEHVAPRPPRRRPVEDAEILSALLSGLGKSRLSSNLNQLARAVNSGSLPVSPETEKAILEACAEIKAMSNNLTKALGVDIGGMDS